ncbi:MAG: NAD-dependent epimerase/dehydratase family protein [Actinomycetota bacterium]
MPTVAITGVSGFIGDAVARRYADNGWTVRGLDLRLPDPADPLTPDTDPRVDYLVGDVTSPAALAELVSGADLVVHTAAIVAESGDWADFDRINARAPRQVALAARDAGAMSFVHLSSVMVHGFSFPHGVDEDGPLDHAANPYCASKIRSEHLLRGLDAPGEFHVHIIRPGDVYGPMSMPWIIRPIQHIRSRTYLVVKGGVINHVYIDNLVDAIEVVAAGGEATSGRAFIATDGVATPARDFWGWYADQMGRGFAPTLPGWLAEPLVGGAAAVLPESWRRRLDLDRQSIRYLRRRAAYSNAALRSLGWAPRVPLEEGRDKTAAWLREVGLLTSA